MPKVSVIMSVYNEPTEWLRIAIDSILNQTFNDFEFIIINDNPSNADNDSILKFYADNDSRIVIINNEKNIGLTKSLNKGLKIAKGEYIARMDADDLSLPLRFEKQVEFLDKHPEILCVGAWTGNIDENGNRLDTIGKYESDYRWVRAQFIQNSQISHPAAMYHKIINNELILYDESVKYAQDYSLMVNILRFGEISNLPEVLFCYRNSDSQITSSKKAEQQACAFKTQTKAFDLFGFNVSSQFLKLFHQLTIQRKRSHSLNLVTREFNSFFKKNKITQDNSLALELIYGNYLNIIKYLYSNSWIKTISHLVRHNNLSMHILGMKLFSHLSIRKLKRIKN